MNLEAFFIKSLGDLFIPFFVPLLLWILKTSYANRKELMKNLDEKHEQNIERLTGIGQTIHAVDTRLARVEERVDSHISADENIQTGMQRNLDQIWQQFERQRRS